MEVLAVTLIAWIAAQTGLSAPESPRVVYVADREIARYYHALAGDDVPPLISSDQNASPANMKSGVLAFYLRDAAAIYLPQSWLPTGLRDRSTLVHELVHHVQRFNRLAPECPAALERQAYDLQAAWLREQGVSDPYEVMGIDQFTVAVLTACMQPDH